VQHWVTLAPTAGVPLELVQMMTGHRTTDIALKHYFQPGREEFRASRASTTKLDIAEFNVYPDTMTTMAEVNEVNGRLAELVRQVMAGNEVVLTQDHRPVAKIVATPGKEITGRASLQIHSLTGHRVLTPAISQAELADEIFGRQ
jgi:antitoxin (DNA-binding transcriptional repressor) of toxin-antitoxin stability system